MRVSCQLPTGARRDEAGSRTSGAVMRQRRSGRLEIVSQCCSQFDDSALKTSAQPIKLDFGARRDVLVPRQHDNPSVRDGTLERRHQIGHVDAGLTRNQMVDHHAGTGDKMLIAVLPQPVQRRCGPAETVDSTPRAACIAPLLAHAHG
jgi:hypothetical protein